MTPREIGKLAEELLAYPGFVERVAADPRVTAGVLARLTLALGAVEAPYSTRRGHEPPEYSSRPKRWRADAPTIPGAVQIGRWWNVSRAAYAAWVATKGSTSLVQQSPVVAPAGPSLVPALPWTPQASLEAMTRRAGAGR